MAALVRMKMPICWGFHSSSLWSPGGSPQAVWITGATLPQRLRPGRSDPHAWSGHAGLRNRGGNYFAERSAASMSSIAMRVRYSGSTKRAWTIPSVPTMKVAGIGSVQSSSP